MMKKSTFGSRVRKRLSDITNLHSQHKSPFKDQENVVIPAALVGSSSKVYVDKLLKENAVMMKLIQEKDKIIESNALELQKMRVNLQTTRMQNWHLAQSNTQMLADLNMGKDKLKALQHELACKEALYKAKILELQDNRKAQCEADSVQEGETKPEKAAVDQNVQGSHSNNNNENKVSKAKRGRPTRSQSLGSTTSQQAVEKEIAENKRRCLRRQSVKLKPQESQADLFEIDVANTPLTKPVQDLLHESSSDRTNDTELVQQSSRHSLNRSSIGRPMRKAAEKVQSYKDPALNTKMRRP